jgi:hypothetical protein
MLYLALRRAEPTTPHLTLPWDTTFKKAGGLVRTAFGRGRPSLRLGVCLRWLDEDEKTKYYAVWAARVIREKK